MAGKSQKGEISQNVVPETPEHETIPPEMAEVLSELPEAQRKEVTRIMTMGFSMISRSSPEGEIAKKITPEHISTMLATQQKGLDYTYKENRFGKIISVVILLIIISTVIVIIILLRDKDPETMSQILTVLISAALGGVGGYGIGVKKRDND